MFNKFFKYFYPYIKTLIFYKPFFKKSGKYIVIINPIKFTARYITMGNKILIAHHARVEGLSNYEGGVYTPSILIGDNVIIQQNLHLTCAYKITISEGTAIAANVTITDINHGYEDISIAPEKQKINVKEVVINKNCKIYNNAVILPGTILGKHNIVGANSVVSGGFPDYCVIAGAPAIILKRYNASTNKWAKTDSKGNFII